MTSIFARIHLSPGTFGSGRSRLREAVSGPWPMLLLFAGARVAMVLHRPLLYPDTGTYLALDFFGGQERLWTVPLAWTLIPTNELRQLVQIALGIAAWWLLALEVWRMLSDTRTRWASIGAILLLGLMPQIAGWDGTLLSESISTSLLIIVVALLLRVCRRPTWVTIGGCLGFVTLWVFTRQLNVLLFACVLPFVVGFLLVRGTRRQKRVVIPVVLIVALWGGYCITRSSPASTGVMRWNALQILENRIAPDSGAIRFFSAHGLPHSSTIPAERGKFPGSTSPLFADHAIMRWVTDHFVVTYAAYLIDHWAHTVGEPLVQLPGTSVLAGTDMRVRQVIPPFINGVLWGTGRFDLGFWALLALALLAMALREDLLSPKSSLSPRTKACRLLTSFKGRLLVILLLVITVLAGSVVTYNATGYGPGSGELARLFLPVATCLHVAILMTLALSVDFLRCASARRIEGPTARRS